MSKKVVHITVGSANFIGEIDEGNYYKKKSTRYLKLENACDMVFVPSPKGMQIQFHKLAQDNNYIGDIEILLDVKEAVIPLIIRTVDPKGSLYQTYKGMFSSIIVPGSGIAQPIMQTTRGLN